MDQTICNRDANGLQFNEEEWIRLVFLLNDTQQWLNDLSRNALYQVPLNNRRKLFLKSFYITIESMSHILERHYYKIPRHPEASKFTIDIASILQFLRDAAKEETIPIPGSLHLMRTIDVGVIIGFDRNQVQTSLLTVVTDVGGKVITAYPGVSAII